MTGTSTTPVTTGTLSVPDAELYYEVRGDGPLLALVAAPMDARSFAPLADLLATDHTVLTTDPRGINRSRVHRPDLESTPGQRADDVARLVAHLGRGPAAVLGSSGGAVTVLALAQDHPGAAHTVIAHEPPVQEMLDDREERRARSEEIVATYLSGDIHGAWVRFMAAANIPIPEEMIDMMFGPDRAAQDLADERFQFERMFRATVMFRPDVAALRSGPTRVVVGIGERSAGQLCDVTSRALAAQLGVEPTMFPGDHTGFAGDPAAFEARLRAVLAE